jgi:hypothetical protein
MTPATFFQLFPEFAETSPNVVSGKLMLAAVEMGGPDFSVWPQFASTSQQGLPITPLSVGDLAHGYLAAHLLQSTAFGTETMLQPTQETTYGRKFDELMRSVAGGMVVAGLGLGSPAGPAPGFVLEPGSGTVTLVNGSLNVTFSIPQSLGAGTVMAFVGLQPGALYALAANVDGTSGTLTAPYTGTSGASSWNVQQT